MYFAEAPNCGVTTKSWSNFYTKISLKKNSGPDKFRGTQAFCFLEYIVFTNNKSVEKHYSHEGLLFSLFPWIAYMFNILFNCIIVVIVIITIAIIIIFYVIFYLFIFFFFLLHHSYYKLVIYSVGSPGCVQPP